MMTRKMSVGYIWKDQRRMVDSHGTGPLVILPVPRSHHIIRCLEGIQISKQENVSSAPWVSDTTERIPFRSADQNSRNTKRNGHVTAGVVNWEQSREWHSMGSNFQFLRSHHVKNWTSRSHHVILCCGIHRKKKLKFGFSFFFGWTMRYTQNDHGATRFAKRNVSKKKTVKMYDGS